MPAPPKREPLHIASDGSVNSRSSTSSLSNKRKREDASPPQSFTARSIDTAVKPSDAIFVPVVLIPRSNLPLLWLTPTPGASTLPSPFIFEAPFPAAWQHDRCALIARLCPNGALYAVEKASKSAWIACQLSSWVSESHCHDAANSPGYLPEQPFGRRSHVRSDSQSTTGSHRPLTPSSPKRPQYKRGAAARVSILSSREDQRDNAKNLPASATHNPPMTNSRAEAVQTPSPSAVDSVLESMAVVQQDAPDASGNQLIRPSKAPALAANELPSLEMPKQDQLSKQAIVQQYLDTLYLSRISLAFYAKASLSRNRALAKSKTDSPKSSLEELLDIYRGCIIAGKRCDLKYKESLPSIVQDFACATLAEPANNFKKRKSSKKIKLGKDGLYNCEHEAVEKWYERRSIKETTVTDTAMVQLELRQALSDLRTREHEMQLLLILEILALEAATATQPGKAADAAVKVESDEEGQAPAFATAPKRKKKPRNLQSDLDSIVDKLCIWHTVSFEDTLQSPEHRPDVLNTSSSSRDSLREFCSEVIKPFYGTKLPKQTKTLCQKLAGMDLSPERHKPVTAKPGVRRRTQPDLVRKASVGSKKTLERVLSEDRMRQTQSPPALSRSASLCEFKQDSPAPELERQISGTSMRPVSRARIQKSVSFIGREIDLVADAKDQVAKKRKLDKITTQQNELKAAIEALKKPNRTSAGREIMDEVEQRKVVHITATPSRRKSTALAKSGGSDTSLTPARRREPELLSVIPSSTAKTKAAISTIPSSDEITSIGAAVSNTPMRASIALLDSVQRLAVPVQLHESIAATPATTRVRPDLSGVDGTPLRHMTQSRKAILFTPMKRGEVDMQNAFRDAPVIPEEAGKAMDRVMGGKGLGGELGLDASTTDIYAQLGWDDDMVITA